ncbi:phage protease [Enterocloster bolteae]|uniref:phage protease n=1 Tax=Enterocloster bolteae TaxID=208479 RepID=UPI001D061BAA|nr:phage protease [Enterocloster bolteae]MCB7236159.1 phage protease [Enterocloster bolteae]MCG4948615.1 phage protease [Enterocloster bolteae]MCG4954588.1 phage protease [Enterocloster bolteae]
MKKTELTVRPLSGIDLSGVPEVIRVLPKGHVSSTKGDFEVDDRDIAGIIRQFKARRLDLVIDYEHQTLSDVQAPAAGWIKDLYPGEDALMARVEWTKKGREYIANKEYRYLSPVVLVKNADQHAAVFHSAALTNTPAITGMFAIINSDALSIEEEEEPRMELSALIELLGLEEGTAEEDVLKRIKELTQQAAEEGQGGQEGKEGPAKEGTQLVANKTVLDLLGLPEDARTEDVTARIMAFKAGDSVLQRRVAELEKQAASQKAEELVGLAMKDGKLSPAQKEWAVAYALSDPKGFAKFVEKAPVVVPMGKTAFAADERKQDGVDWKILKNQGVTEEDLKKYGGMEDDTDGE